MRELASALMRAGAETGDALIDCTRDAFTGAWEELQENSAPGDPLIVHFAGHGIVGTGTGTLFLATIQGDVRKPARTCVSVRGLVEEAEEAAQASGRPVLILLDVCHAGQAIVLQQLADLAARRPQSAVRNVWIIGASTDGSLAFGARFTTATAEVLHRLVDGDLDISPREEYVPFLTLAEAIHRHLAATDRAAGRPVQDVVRTPLAQAAPPSPPFFRNPDHNPDLRSLQLSGIHPSLRDLADVCSPGLDPLHFAGRAAGDSDVHAVLFSGRASQLSRIQDWISDTGPAGRSLVVTGGPGSGKSALLGVTACLLHPELQGIGDHIATFVEDFYPRRPDTVLAVHARQLTLQQITGSLHRQLHRQRGDSPADAPPEGVDPGPAATTALLAELETTGDVLVILDALDEAMDPAAVLNELLLPLATAPDLAGCRVAIGTRPWWDSLPNLRRHLAENPSARLDLDPANDAERRALAGDLDAYLRKLLHPRAPDAREHVRRIADRLARYTDHGAFLVAGLYAEHLRTTSSYELIDPPCTVVDVFDLHVDTLAANDPWIRPVLEVLGHARGRGIPLDLVHAAALTHRPPAPGHPTPQLTDTRRALRKAAFYLRTTPDSDQHLLYRYFHQALTDHTAPLVDPGTFHQALLDAVPTTAEGFLDWGLSHPYLRRHAADHAAAVADETLEELLLTPGYVEVADLDRLLFLTERFHTSERAEAVLDVVRQITGRDDPPRQRSARGALLALTALHLGHDPSALPFSGTDTHGMRVRWATSVMSRYRSLPVQSEPVSSVDVFAVPEPDGSTRDVIASACADGWVRVWDAGTMTAIAEVDLSPARPVGVKLFGFTDGPLVLFVMDDSFEIWWGAPLGEGVLRPIGRGFPVSGREGRTWVARTVRDEAANRMVVLWGRAEHEYETRFSVLDFQDESGRVGHGVIGESPLLGDSTGVGLWPYGGGHLARPQADANGDESGDMAVVVAANPLTMDEMLLMDLERGARVGRMLMGSARAIRESRTVLCGRMGGASAVAIGNKRGEVEIRTVVSDGDGVTVAAEPTMSFTAHFGAVSDLALGVVGGREVLLSAGRDGAIHLWDLRRHHADRPPTRFAGAIACLCLARSPRNRDEDLLVVAGDTSGSVGAVIVESGGSRHFFPSHHDGEVTGVAAAEMPVAGTVRTLVASCSTDQSIRLFDAETGHAVGRPFGGIVEPLQASCRMTAVAAGPLAGRSVVVGAAAGQYRRHRYHSLYVFASGDWSDTASHTLLNEPLFGTLSRHGDAVLSITLGTVRDGDVLVTGCLDGHVRMWDGASFEQSGPGLETGGHAVFDVWLGDLLGRTVVLAACGDGTLRIWDANTSEVLAEPLAAHAGGVRGVGVTTGTTGPVVVTTGTDATVRTWDPSSWHEYGPPHPLLHPGTALDCRKSSVVVASGASLVRFDLDRSLT
ncbi:AAA family ATPase [Streptomyces sp. B93]|uniref:AAA family ATPase n=1 Tax=Streptomyces sp. B93 TaxID=2824875 RepID=UPI001B39B751|nr:AAA family ATPase [Streptomyces sp. B93]MBQ1091383.1 caspase family protein [Streptomyces sp. B93]